MAYRGKRLKAFTGRNFGYTAAYVIFTRDGIHLNDEGHQAFYRSYRGAILFALNCEGDGHFQS